MVEEMPIGFQDLIIRLYQAGSIGADLSPGDPLCTEAAHALESLQEQIHRLIRDFYEGKANDRPIQLR